MKYWGVFVAIGLITGFGAGTMTGLTIAHNMLKPVEVIRVVEVPIGDTALPDVGGD